MNKKCGSSYNEKKETEVQMCSTHLRPMVECERDRLSKEIEEVLDCGQWAVPDCKMRPGALCIKHLAMMLKDTQDERDRLAQELEAKSLAYTVMSHQEMAASNQRDLARAEAKKFEGALRMVESAVKTERAHHEKRYAEAVMLFDSQVEHTKGFVSRAEAAEKERDELKALVAEVIEEGDSMSKKWMEKARSTLANREESRGAQGQQARASSSGKKGAD